jgi:hypothetical protein
MNSSGGQENGHPATPVVFLVDPDGDVTINVINTRHRNWLEKLNQSLLGRDHLIAIARVVMM